MRARFSRVLAAAALCVLAACGWGSAAGTSGDGDAARAVLRDAAASLAERRSGEVEVALRASADGAGTVGFQMAGPYSFEHGGDLAVLDLTYTLLLGEERTESRIVSDGSRSWVVADGEAVALDDTQTAALRLSEAPSAVPELDIASWLSAGETAVDGDVTTVTGELDLVAFLADLQRLSADIGGETGLERPDPDDEARLLDLVDERRLTVETVGGDHRFRSLRAVVDFGSRVPERLRDALGQFAGARLELALVVGDLEGELEVVPPSES